MLVPTACWVGRARSVIAAIILCMHAAGALRADEGAGAGRGEGPSAVDPRSSVALLNESIAFYASFDHGRVDADLAAGRADPIRSRGTIRFVEGRFGSALLLGSDGGGARLTYSTAQHLDFRRPGALSLWVRPHRWTPPGADRRGYIRFVTVVAQPASFVVQRMGFDRATKRRDRLIAGFFDLPGARLNYVQLAGTEKWGDDRWRLIVVNWDQYGVEVSVDGEPFARRASPNGLDYGPLVENGGSASFALGHHTDETTAVDELTLYTHALELADVERLLAR